MRKIGTVTLLLALTLAAGAQAMEAASPLQSKINTKAAHPLNYPKIVLYSVSWCPHCKQAKEYFTEHNIPFINRDVELDPQAMEELTGKYRSQGVPVIVIGNDQKILKGFSPELFEKAVKSVEGQK